MYEKAGNIIIHSSVSALGNNLSVWCEKDGLVHYSVVHKNHVNIVTDIDHKSIKARELTCKDVRSTGIQAMILQAKWVILDNQILFVIASERGVQIFDSDGSALLHWHAFDTDPDNLEGTHNGTILAFEVPDDAQDITLVDKLKGHLAAITDLRSSKNLLASADESGAICLWEGGSSLTKFRTLESYGSTCTGIIIWNDFVLAGYGTGHLRVFSVISGQIVAEVTAHARWISAIDVAPETGLILSVSEDSFVRVWQLSTSDSVISHKFSQCIQDSQLQGGCFINPTGNAFSTTAYDRNEIMCFRM